MQRLGPLSIFNPSVDDVKRVLILVLIAPLEMPIFRVPVVALLLAGVHSNPVSFENEL
jgi:hypothetical protein